MTMIPCFDSLRTAVRSVVFFAAVCTLALAPALRAQEAVVTLDPAATKIDFTLGATLHTVHGTFKLKSGEIRFDPATGKASGAVIVDATSGYTDNSSRDKKMHAEILESAKFPEILFMPNHVSGPLGDLLFGKGTAQLQVAGVIRLHGQDHDVTLAISVEPATNGQLHAAARFAVPYIQWGLKNPSTFVLRVSDTVNLDIDAAARIAPAAPPTR
ncbi:MAG: YceI family protein [Candidatus Acidiferrales bacterium]|jgi:polyisoprenoid-binding protein YceI